MDAELGVLSPGGGGGGAISLGGVRNSVLGVEWGEGEGGGGTGGMEKAVKRWRLRGGKDERKEVGGRRLEGFRTLRLENIELLKELKITDSSTLHTYGWRRNMGECICPLSWNVHRNFAPDGR
jgi:hypothetical protein